MKTKVHVTREMYLYEQWFEASAAMLMRRVLFCDIMQRQVVILYWHFGTMYRSHLQGLRSPTRKKAGKRVHSLYMEKCGCFNPIGCHHTSSHRPHLSLYKLCRVLPAFFSSWTSWPLKMGPIHCPETSVKDYHSTLCNIPEERRSYL
jgi:hypothetical protein